MKKNLFFVVIALLAVAFCVSSCGKKSENLNSIPKSAFVVVTCDGKAWKDATNPEALANNEEFQEGLKELEQMSQKLKDLVDKIMKDPNESGIMMDEMLYAFADMDKENVIVGVIASVDKEKLEANIKLISEELEVPFKAEEKDGISYFMPESDMIVGWSKTKMMVLVLAEGYDYDLEKRFFALMNQDKKESILEDKDFNAFLKDSKDFNIWISSNVVNSLPDSEGVKMAEKMVGFNFSDNYGHIHFDAEKGEWTLTAKLRFNESIQKADWNKVIENLDEMGAFDGLMDDFFGGYDDEEYEMDSLGGEYSDLTEEEWAEIEKLMQESK
ncbi:MAG: DUF4836 family protein [Bacteroidales bacterium]|nr:DUF4836 family protein [Bacteroidales bacterium]